MLAAIRGGCDAQLSAEYSSKIPRVGIPDFGRNIDDSHLGRPQKFPRLLQTQLDEKPMGRDTLCLPEAASKMGRRQIGCGGDLPETDVLGKSRLHKIDDPIELPTSQRAG